MSYCIVLDTETTSLDKPFCYDISWVIMDKDKGTIVDFKTCVVEQVWHNLPLFESAYYKEKRQKYIDMMRRHDAVMDKWGYIMRKLKQDIIKYDVTEVYAYNSDFDDKVITYNCDWFKCNNPLESVAVYDIWGSEFIEEHMGLFDSEIEAEILWECIRRGAKWATPYKANKILPRPVLHPFTIKMDGVEVFSGEYAKKYVRNDTYNFKSTI